LFVFVLLRRLMGWHSSLECSSINVRTITHICLSCRYFFIFLVAYSRRPYYTIPFMPPYHYLTFFSSVLCCISNAKLGGARRGVSVLERKQHLALGNLGQKREKREAALRGHCAETPQKPARDGPGSVPSHSPERPKALGVLLSFNGWRCTLYSSNDGGLMHSGTRRKLAVCDRGGCCVFESGRKR